jgi:hypothetical protein
MNLRNRWTGTLLALTLALAPACSNGGPAGSEDADGAERGSTKTTAEAPAVAAVLLPAEGPLPAGTYAVPGFVPLLTMELEEGWTVIGRAEGAVTLAYEFDPEGTELARLNLAEVTGHFDAPFVEPETMMTPGLQQARVRPLPPGGLRATLSGLPGVEVGAPSPVEVGSLEGERFDVTVGDLPAEAKTTCPQIPSGCVAAYDLPGALAAVFPGGTAHDLTTLRKGETTYLAALNAPSTGPPAGFEAAAERVIESLSVDRRVELPAEAVRSLYVGAVADLELRPLARSVAAPGSPAATFMAALDDDRAVQLLLGNEVPKREVSEADGKMTVSDGRATETYESFTYEDGLLASFVVQGRPIDDFVAAIDSPKPVEVGPLEVTPLETYRSFVSGRLWVPVRVRNGAEAIVLQGFRVTHVSADGTERPSQPLDGLEVAAHWDAPFTLLFEDAPLGGTLVFSGTLAGQPVDAKFELPTPDAG